MGGLHFGIDRDGNAGYYEVDGTFSPFYQPSDEISVTLQVSGTNNWLKKDQIVNVALLRYKRIRLNSLTGLGTYLGAERNYVRVYDPNNNILYEATANFSTPVLVDVSGHEFVTVHLSSTQYESFNSVLSFSYY